MSIEIEPKTVRPTRRRWLQFSLRTFLLLVLVTSVWMGWYIRSVRRQQDSVRAITAVGGAVIYEHQFDVDGLHYQIQSRLPASLSRKLDNYLYDVEGVKLFAIKTDPNDALQHLEGVPKVEQLVFAETGVTDDGLRYVAQLQKLELLHLAIESAVSDAGIEHFANHPSLVYFGIEYTEVTGNCLRTLRTIPSLRELSLRGNRISDDGLRYLRNMEQLKRLDLSGNEITDRGLAHLSRLRNLERLYLSDTGVTNAGLDHLVELHNLEWVTADGTQITDVGRLQKALPNCRITGVITGVR